MADPLFIALHVPKCAGTTIEAHLATHLGPQGFWSPPKRTRKLPLEILGRKYDRRLPGPAERVRAVSGHFVGRSVLGLFPGRRARITVLLRDPAALMLSWYNYRMMRYLAQGLKPYPFGLHVRAMPPDPVAHFLLERWFEMPWARMAALSPDRKIALLDAALGSFERVDDVSGADRLIADISAELGIPTVAERSNTAEEWTGRTGWERLAPAAIPEADRALLDRRTALDRYLWRRWALGEDIRPDPAAAAPFLLSELARPLAELRRRAVRRA